MTFGLLSVSGSLFWQSQLTVTSGYSALLPGFVLMGIGMAFVMSPMSMAAMNAVEQTKAGVASGILSMNRMVGGTFGVAVLGAMVATLGRSKIDQLLPRLPGAERARSWPPGWARCGVHGVPRDDHPRERWRLRVRAAARTAPRLRRGADRGAGGMDARRPARRRGAAGGHRAAGRGGSADRPAGRRPQRRAGAETAQV